MKTTWPLLRASRDGSWFLSFVHTWTIPAVVVRVIDGDTVVVHMEIMPGFVLHEAHVRVQGINAPEMNTVAGKAAKLAAEVFLPVNMVIMLAMQDTDKYGRMLGKITMSDGQSFGDLMIASGHAVVYNP
jgi:endonuclease YncB( thermonuclease family)